MTDATTPETFVERGLALYSKLIQLDAGLTRELARSQEEFFGSTRRSRGRDARLRHLEWFLTEHGSDEMAPLAGEGLLDAFLERADDSLASFPDALRESIVSVFEVTGVQEDRGVWIRDFSAGGEYPLAEPEAAGELAEGDLIIGRLYPLGDGSFRASPSAGCFRNPSMLEALRSDLAVARETRRGTPRISQAGLEALFFAETAAEVRPSESADEAMAKAASWLLDNSVDEDHCEAIFAELRATAFDPGSPDAGVEDPLSRILSELPLHSDPDIAEAREVLLEAWSSMWNVERPTVDGNAGTDVRSALAEFDRARAAGGNLEELFDKLERDLGIEKSDHDEDSNLAPDFPGVVGAMVDEFLWEQGRSNPHRLPEFQLLRKLNAFGAPIGVFEELAATHLLEFASCWLLEHGDLNGPDEAQVLLRVLGDFCSWADENHGLELCKTFGESLRALQESLPRLIEANRHLGCTPHGKSSKVFEVADVQQGRVLLRSEGRTCAFDVPEEVAVFVRPADLMRVASETPDPPRLIRCYPPQSAVVLLSSV